MRGLIYGVGLLVGSAMEKWFVYYGWPDTTATPAIVMTGAAIFLAGYVIVKDFAP